MKEKGSRNRVVGGGPRERRIRDPIERLPRSVFLRRTNAWMRRREREREESVVPRSNGVDLNRTNLFVSLVLVEIRGVEGKSCLLREDEMAVSIVFHRNGSVRMAREETTFF